MDLQLYRAFLVFANGAGSLPSSLLPPSILRYPLFPLIHVTFFLFSSVFRPSPLPFCY